MPGSEFTTGLRDRRPPACTAKTSMSLPFALVVTISCDPAGENATCPGVLVNCGVAVGSRPSGRFDPGIGNSRPRKTRYPWTDPPFSAFTA